MHMFSVLLCLLSSLSVLDLHAMLTTFAPLCGPQELIPVHLLDTSYDEFFFPGVHTPLNEHLASCPAFSMPQGNTSSF